jgi:hypothetical protein
MLPPPRKPAPGAANNPPPQPIPTADLASAAEFAPESVEPSFVAPNEAAGETDFFSELSGPSLGMAAASVPSSAGSGNTISKTSKNRRPAPQNQKWIWITTGSVAAGVAVLVAVIVLLGGNGTQPTANTSTNTSGATAHAKPESKTAEPSAVASVPIAAAGNAADSDRLVTDALPDLKHWSTDLDAAKRQAALEKKDILLVFFGSDKREWCLQLAADLLVKPEFRKYVDPRFELVLLEAPPASSMVDGKGVGRAAEIAKAAADYTVTSFPTIVLTDAEGTAFAREEYKQIPLVDHLKSFSSGLAIRKERDKLFAPTETGSDAARVYAAQLALEWLEKNELAALYAAKIHSWLELAEKIDPNNEHGQVESFFLAEVRQRLNEAGKDNPQKIHDASQPLDDWQKSGRKFKNGDLAARTYLAVAAMLFNAGDPDDGIKLLEGAYNCNPSDPRLKAYLGRLHEMTSSPVSFGSGFVFAAGGYILTNNHVIAGEGKIFVRVAGNKKEIPAEVVSTSPQLDVAVIKMVGEIPAIKPLPLATATLPRGTEVVAFGFPLGQEDVKLTQGPVSAPPSEKEHFYVLDLRVNPGNSGGPLVDMRGEVVGIVSAKTISRDEKEDSYGLAIPGQTVAGFIKQITPSIPDYHPLTADETAKLPELDKLTKVDAIVSPAVVQIVKRRG